ncbi:MAG TPA: PAS domain S-box protein [Minicystis sp.]|nr:PAS domain S-box protein [Minicystis sp.]
MVDVLRLPMDPTDPYRMIVESVRDYALILLDPAGNITTWNPGAETIFGYAPEEAIGRHVAIFYPPEDRATKPDSELGAALEGRYEEEGFRVRKDGRRFWANVIATPVKEDGRLRGFAKVVRDMTERVEAERERAAQREAIRRLSMPVIRLWSRVLLLPLVGDLDPARADDVSGRLLERVIAEDAKVVILDVAGIPAMSTDVADTVIKLTKALRLVGARPILTGMGPSAARAIVRLDVDLGDVTTCSTLDAGLEVALSLVGRRIVEG